MVKKESLGYDIPLLAFITAITYFMSSLYQSGYARFYGYSPAFLGFDINVLLDSALPITYAALVIFVGIVFLNKVQGKRYGNTLFIASYLIISPLVYLFIINGGGFHFIYPSEIYVMAFFILFSLIVAMYIPMTFKMGLQRNKKINFSEVLSNSIMIVFISYPIGIISAASQSDFYQVKGGKYYLLSNVSNNYVLGSCLSGKATYKIEKPDSSIEFIRVNSDEEKFKIKNCFHESAKTDQSKVVSAFPDFKIKNYGWRG